MRVNRQTLGALPFAVGDAYWMEAWPDRLRRLRNATQPRLSQAAVAKHFNIAPASVAQWELGRSKPAIDKLLELSALYDVTLDELCGEDLSRPFGSVVPRSGFKGVYEVQQSVEQQLLLIRRAWTLLSLDERNALLTTAETLAAARRKSA